MVEKITKRREELEKQMKALQDEERKILEQLGEGQKALAEIRNHMHTTNGAILLAKELEIPDNPVEDVKSIEEKPQLICADLERFCDPEVKCEVEFITDGTARVSLDIKWSLVQIIDDDLPRKWLSVIILDDTTQIDPQRSLVIEPDPDRVGPVEA